MAASTSSESTQLEATPKALTETGTSASGNDGKIEANALPQDQDHTAQPQKTEYQHADLEQQGKKQPEVAIGHRAAVLLFIG